MEWSEKSTRKWYADSMARSNSRLLVGMPWKDGHDRVIEQIRQRSRMLFPAIRTGYAYIISGLHDRNTVDVANNGNIIRLPTPYREQRWEYCRLTSQVNNPFTYGDRRTNYISSPGFSAGTVAATIKTFLIEDLPPVSITPVVHPELRISLRIFKKIRDGPNGIFRGLGETDSWKKPEVENLLALFFRFHSLQSYMQCPSTNSLSNSRRFSPALLIGRHVFFQ